MAAYVDAVNAGDVGRISALSCADERAALGDSAEPDGVISIDTIDRISIQGDTAYAFVTFTQRGSASASGAEENFNNRVRFTREQGTWKVCGDANGGG